jgi:hypothetical protein
MKRDLVTRLLAIAAGALGVVVLLFGEGPAAQLARVTDTQRIDFAPGGTIRVDKSWGDLYIEGWDQPRVEITVTKTTSYSDNLAHLKVKTAPKLETIKVAGERRSDSEMAISTRWAPRAKRVPPFSKGSKNGVHLEYAVHVPRDSRLIIDHHGGSVEVGNVTGEIDAANRDGDILLMLPAGGAYAIDARSKLGHIASDFEGKTLSRYFAGQRFVGTNASGSRRIHLRTGFGGITILAIPPEGELLSTAGSE